MARALESLQLDTLVIFLTYNCNLSLKSDQVDNLEESVKVGLEKVEAACWEMVDSATVS